MRPISPLFQGSSVPRQGPAWAIRIIPGSSWARASASRTHAESSVSIQAPSFNLKRRNASAVSTSPAGSTKMGYPLRLNGGGSPNGRGILLPESGRRSGTTGKTRMAFAGLRATTANARDESRRAERVQHMEQRRNPAVASSTLVELSLLFAVWLWRAQPQREDAPGWQARL